MLMFAGNSRPQQSTGVAPLEFVSPNCVRSLSVNRMVATRTGEATNKSPRGVLDAIQFRLRSLIHKLR